MANRNHSAGQPCDHPKVGGHPECTEHTCPNYYMVSPDLIPHTCTHALYGGTNRCAEMSCPNYYMKGSGFWRGNGDELPGMWEPADLTGGETDAIPEHYYGVKIPDSLRPNWNDLRPEVAWWKNGVRDALGGLIQNTLADLESTPIGYDEKTTGPLKLVGKCGCTWNATGTTRMSVCGPHRRINERNKRGKTGA